MGLCIECSVELDLKKKLLWFWSGNTGVSMSTEEWSISDHFRLGSWDTYWTQLLLKETRFYLELSSYN